MAEGEPVYLMKNGYETMVVLSTEEYSRLISLIDAKLSKAEMVASSNSKKKYA